MNTTSCKSLTYLHLLPFPLQRLFLTSFYLGTAHVAPTLKDGSRLVNAGAASARPVMTQVES
jgi:hypothetical protein